MTGEPETDRPMTAVSGAAVLLVLMDRFRTVYIEIPTPWGTVVIDATA